MRLLLIAALFASSGCIMWGKHYPASGYVATFSSVVANSEECFTDKHGVEFRKDPRLTECPPQSKVESLIDLFLIEHKLRKESLSRVEVTFTPDAVTCGHFPGAFTGCTRRNFVVIQLQGRVGTWNGWGTTMCYELGNTIGGPPFTLYTEDLRNDLKEWAKEVNKREAYKVEKRRLQGRFKYGCVSRQSIEGSMTDSVYWPKGAGW